MMFDNIEFLNKEFFWLLLLLPIAIIWYVLKYNKQTAELKISSIKGFKVAPSISAKEVFSLILIETNSSSIFLKLIPLFSKKHWQNWKRTMKAVYMSFMSWTMHQ